jgi:hypothetical protein
VIDGDGAIEMPLEPLRNERYFVCFAEALEIFWRETNAKNSRGKEVGRKWTIE